MRKFLIVPAILAMTAGSAYAFGLGGAAQGGGSTVNIGNNSATVTQSGTNTTTQSNSNSNTQTSGAATATSGGILPILSGSIANTGNVNLTRQRNFSFSNLDQSVSISQH